jgi:drug/metabolite transporter (DMT)-like permease
MIRGITGFLALALYFFAISKIPLATAVMLNYTSPLFVALMAPLVLKESVNLKIFLIILLGFVGVLLIVKPHPNTDFLGPSWVLSQVFSQPVLIFPSEHSEKNILH